MSNGCSCMAGGSLQRYDVSLTLPSVGDCPGQGGDGSCDALTGGFLGLPKADYGSDGASPVGFVVPATAPAVLHNYHPDAIACTDEILLFNGCNEPLGFAGEVFDGFDLTWYQYVVNGQTCQPYTLIQAVRVRLYNLIFNVLPFDPWYGTYLYAHHAAVIFEFLGRWAPEFACVSNAKLTFNGGISRNRVGSNDATKIPCCVAWRGAHDLAAGVVGTDGPCPPKWARWLAKPVPCFSPMQGSDGVLGYPIPVAYTPGVTILPGGPGAS